MSRIENETCEFCGRGFYCRPSHKKKYKHHFCSLKCFAEVRVLKSRKCPVCGTIFQPNQSKHIYCSGKCAGKGSRRSWSTRKGGTGLNEKKKYLQRLKDTFNFTSCMVEGCTYNKTYDVHRYIPGKEGGEYIIGNMFVICPNHHMEIHRKLVTMEKINDYTLRPTYIPFT